MRRKGREITDRSRPREMFKHSITSRQTEKPMDFDRHADRKDLGSSVSDMLEAESVGWIEKRLAWLDDGDAPTHRDGVLRYGCKGQSK